MSLLPLILAFAAQSAADTFSPPGTNAKPDATQLRELLEDCSAHRFEAVVSAEVEGKLKRSKMKLCGTTGQSDSDWLRTLSDSAQKIAANDGIAKPMRDEMVKALKGEIAMRSAFASASTPGAGSGTGIAAEGYSLKSRPVISGAAKDKGLAAYTSLPPLPPPVSVAEATRDAASKPFVPPPPIIRPDLRFECFSTTSVGAGPCVDFDRFTVMVISARSPLAPGSTLRFLRDGEQRAEVAFGGMVKGQRRQVALPQPVCKGVNGGQLKLEIMTLPRNAKLQPQLADSLGPYILRC